MGCTQKNAISEIHGIIVSNTDILFLKYQFAWFERNFMHPFATSSGEKTCSKLDGEVISHDNDLIINKQIAINIQIKL